MSASLSITGLKDLQAQLLDFGATMAVKILASAARKAFLPVLADAKSFVPVDSGALQDSIKVSATKPKNGDAVVVVGLRIGKTSLGRLGELAPHRRWHWIELGTSKLAAHPFMRPALDRNAQGILDTLKTEIAKGIAAQMRKNARAAAK